MDKTPKKESLFKTARIAVASNGFHVGQVVSVEYMPNTRWGGSQWYLVNGDQIALPADHLTRFVL